MSLEGKALGDINQARVAREYYLPLHISTTMSSNPITLNVVIIPVSDANTDQMDINIISVQAQEQLQLAVKAQEKEQKEQAWVEEDWKSQKDEWSRVVVSDKDAV